METKSIPVWGKRAALELMALLLSDGYSKVTIVRSMIDDRNHGFHVQFEV